jgi:hypothetical protein
MPLLNQRYVPAFGEIRVGVDLETELLTSQQVLLQMPCKCGTSRQPVAKPIDSDVTEERAIAIAFFQLTQKRGVALVY